MIRSLLRALPAAALLWCALPPQAQDLTSTALAAVNKLSDGGFEGATPSYWSPTGAGAAWSTERAHSGTHSLKLSGAGAASWTQGEVVRNWVQRIEAQKALTLGAWVYAEGVNTSPASDDAKFQLVVTFRDANGADALGQPVVLDLPQTAASTNGWVNVNSSGLGTILLQSDARSVTAVVRKGAAATGTVYVDDFYFSGAGGQTWHGANVDLPGDWYTFWPGFDGGPADPNWIMAKTTAQSHSGGASLQIERLGAVKPGEEAVAITQRVPVTVGKPVLISYWLKTDGNANPSTIGTGKTPADDNNVGIVAIWYDRPVGGRNGYGEIGGDDIRLNGEFNSNVIPLLPRQAANGWTQYAFVVYPRPNSQALEVRLRYWHQFTGKTYWDDVFVGDVSDAVSQIPNLLPASAEGFEGTTPSYWAPTGAGATWSTTRAHSGTRSLALTGPGAASWTQSEVVRNWVSEFPAQKAFTFGAYVYTEGVNTAPATDADKFQLALTFRDANGADILGQPVVVDLPQTAASTSGWTEITSAALGDITLSSPAKSVTAVLRKGINATGTVYVDDFYFRGAGGQTWHGANVDLPADWYTFWPGFDGGPADPNWVMAKTTAVAHTGNASLQIERLGAVKPGEEAVAITQRVAATPGEPMLVSYWLKTDGNANPSTIGTGKTPADDNNVGIVAIWYRSLASGAAGYNEIGGDDIRLNGEFNPNVIPLLPRQAANDWTNYAFVVYPRPESKALEVRLRYWHQFTGKTYWDDVTLASVAGANLFGTAGEEAPAPGDPSAPTDRWMTVNAPNPFASRTEIRFTLPRAEEVTLEVYDLLGRRVALLADNAPMAAAAHAVAFDRGSLSSGTYLVVLRTLSHSEARQITVVR